jgi:hypothetical protein
MSILSNTWRVRGSAAAIVLLLLVSGCHSPRELTRKDLEDRGDAIHLRTVKLADGSELDFRSDSLGYAVIQDSMIVGRLKSGEFRRVPLDSVRTPGGTRYPTSSERGIENLIVVCSVVALVLWLTMHPPMVMK